MEIFPFCQALHISVTVFLWIKALKVNRPIKKKPVDYRRKCIYIHVCLEDFPNGDPNT